MIKLIACVGKNYELGIDNHMPWSLKGDLKYFRNTTEGQTVVMGKNTYFPKFDKRAYDAETVGQMVEDGLEYSFHI